MHRLKKTIIFGFERKIFENLKILLRGEEMETKKLLEKSVLSIMGAWISNKFGLCCQLWDY